jgi:chromosomal replication initiation ATPase DnaA
MQVVRAVCDARRIRVDYVLSKSQVPALVDARREIAGELREAGWSYPQIGALLRRDHTTVIALMKQGAVRDELLLRRRIREANRRSAA